MHILQILLHIDQYLFSFVSTYGAWTYTVLFMIIFCETGLVITPFLPGDSLLFAAGSIAATAGQQTLNHGLLFILLITASIIGNQINYFIGRWAGPHLLWMINKKHLAKTHAFYEKHGGKTILLGRFLPIIRTIVPFVAGMSEMRLMTFTIYNVVSAIVWIGSLLYAGYFFGSLPWVKDNFSLVIYGIVVVSVMPAVVGVISGSRGQAAGRRD